MVKKYKFTVAQLKALPISAGEARKLLGKNKQEMSDDDVARKILLLTELGKVLIKTLDLQK